MISWFAVALLCGQDGIVLDPEEPKLERREGRWHVRVFVKTDLPDGSFLQLHLQPLALRFHEGRKVLFRQESEEAPPVRKMPVRRGRAELVLPVAAPGRIRVRFFAEAEGRTGQAGREFVLGTVEERGALLREGMDLPEKIGEPLRRALDRLEEAARAGKPGKALDDAVRLLTEVRERCRRAPGSGAWSATLGLLDAVAGDALTYASWLAGRGTADRKSGGDARDPASKDEGDRPAADGQDCKGGVPAPPAPSDGGRRGAGSMEGESVDRLRKRLEAVSAVRRSETHLQVCEELMLLVEAALHGAKIDRKATDLLSQILDSTEGSRGSTLRNALPSLSQADPSLLRALSVSLRKESESLLQVP